MVMQNSLWLIDVNQILVSFKNSAGTNEVQLLYLNGAGMIHWY